MRSDEMSSLVPISPESYIADRVAQYKGWYDKKAVRMKSRYLYMRAFSVVGGSVVPVLANVSFSYIVLGVSVIQLLLTVISLLVVIAVSLESVYHYREQWKNYRSTEQLLGHEEFLYRSRVGRYFGMNDQEAFRLFVERVEEAIAIENSATLNVMTMASETVEATKHAQPRVLPQE
ncbi:DUF4231 domain-containing protein [Pseudomonas veronii]|uniref:DUF4231 domain-containing protein n=1 Tax=Pseudomonas veronii TaxID=76761 RepID=UPI0015A1B6F8|nr:DUF4231 domain-containing protein [Pseudomonas veronii]NWD55318.1 DUF4231 domain-containing protein [Pseudomonas veronii]